MRKGVIIMPILDMPVTIKHIDIHRTNGGGSTNGDVVIANHEAVIFDIDRLGPNEVGNIKLTIMITPATATEVAAKAGGTIKIGS
jgi:hypothetical protein